MRTPHLLACLLLACGSRTGLGVSVSSSDAGPSGSCVTPPAPSTPCKSWSLGARTVIAPPPDASVSRTLGGLVKTDCGVLVAWAENDATGATTWTTRAVAYDSAPLAPPLAHPSLSSPGPATTGAVSFARAGATVGALFGVCQFRTMDFAGHELSSPSITQDGTACIGLAARADGAWTFLRTSADGTTPLALDALDQGKITETPLTTPPQRALWDRLVFDDGTFLVDTFAEDVATAKYQDWLAPFDAKGKPAGSEVVVPDYDSAPVLLVPAGTGALAVWTWDSLYATPIDRHGAFVGAKQAVAAKKSVYEIALAPAPDGDVLLAWSELGDASALTTYVAAMSPEGTLRGPSTFVDKGAAASRMFAAVDPSGARAVLVTSMTEGLVAQALACAP